MIRHNKYTVLYFHCIKVPRQLLGLWQKVFYTRFYFYLYVFACMLLLYQHCASIKISLLL